MCGSFVGALTTRIWDGTRPRWVITVITVSAGQWHGLCPCVVVASYKGLKAAFNPQSLTMTEEQMHGKGKGLDLPAGHTQLTGPSWADRGTVALASCSRSNWAGATNGRSSWTLGSGSLRAIGLLITLALKDNLLIFWKQKFRAETSLCGCGMWVKHQKLMFQKIKLLTRTGDGSEDDHWHFSCRSMKQVSQTPGPQRWMIS